MQAYSSALLNVIPEFATAFYQALVEDNEDVLDELLRDALIPFVALRDKGQGYAISLVKAGVRLRGGDVGSVRPPLVDPPAAHVDALREILVKLDLAHPLSARAAQPVATSPDGNAEVALDGRREVGLVEQNQ